MAVTGQDGTFQLRGLPPGEYEISAWHEIAEFRKHLKTRKVTVKAGEKKELDFTIDWKNR